MRNNLTISHKKWKSVSLHATSLPSDAKTQLEGRDSHYQMEIHFYASWTPFVCSQRCGQITTCLAFCWTRWSGFVCVMLQMHPNVATLWRVAANQTCTVKWKNVWQASSAFLLAHDGFPSDCNFWSVERRMVLLRNVRVEHPAPVNSDGAAHCKSPRFSLRGSLGVKNMFCFELITCCHGSLLFLFFIFSSWSQLPVLLPARLRCHSSGHVCEQGLTATCSGTPPNVQVSVFVFRSCCHLGWKINAAWKEQKAIFSVTVKVNKQNKFASTFWDTLACSETDTPIKFWQRKV